MVYRKVDIRLHGKGMVYRKVDIRLHGKGNSKLPWRKAGQPRHLVDAVGSDQKVVIKKLSLWFGVEGLGFGVWDLGFRDWG